MSDTSHSRTTPGRPVDEPATGAQMEQEAVEAAAARSAMPTRDQDAPVSQADEDAALDALDRLHTEPGGAQGSIPARTTGTPRPDGAPKPSPSPRSSTATTDGSSATGGSDQRSPDELRADIAALRADLGDTVEELHHRVDVPARVKARTAETTERVKVAATDTGALLQDRYAQGREVLAEKAPAVDRQLRERPAIVGAVALAPLLLLLILRLVRRSRTARS